MSRSTRCCAPDNTSWHANGRERGANDGGFAWIAFHQSRSISCALHFWQQRWPNVQNFADHGSLWSSTLLSPENGTSVIRHSDVCVGEPAAQPEIHYFILAGRACSLHVNYAIFVGHSVRLSQHVGRNKILTPKEGAEGAAGI